MYRENMRATMNLFLNWIKEPLLGEFRLVSVDS